MRGGRLGSFWSKGPEVSFLAFLLSFFVNPSSLPRLVVARNWGRFCIVARSRGNISSSYRISFIDRPIHCRYRVSWCISYTQCFLVGSAQAAEAGAAEERLP